LAFGGALGVGECDYLRTYLFITHEDATRNSAADWWKFGRIALLESVTASGLSKEEARVIASTMDSKGRKVVVCDNGTGVKLDRNSIRFP